MTEIIGIGNQKGGVSKTSNAVNLAAALGEMGRRCLVIDLDRNRGASKHFGIQDEDGFVGTFEVLTGKERIEDAIVTTEDGVKLPKNVHLVSARRNLEDLDRVLAEKGKFFIPQDVLIAPLKAIAGKYDYAFLDTAPNASIATIATYKAAEWFLLSAMPSPLAIAGLNDALMDIKQARDCGNPNLKVLGVIVSCYNNTNIAKRLTQNIEQSFHQGDRSAKFATNVTQSTVVSEAQDRGKTLFQHDRSHKMVKKLVKEYLAIAAEIEQRIQTYKAA